MSTPKTTDPHVHRRPSKNDFEGKTVARFEADADNCWRIWFTDGSAFAIQCDIGGAISIPFMEVCDLCVRMADADG